MPVFRDSTELGSHEFWRKLCDLHREKLRLELRNTLPWEFWSTVTGVTWCNPGISFLLRGELGVQHEEACCLEMSMYTVRDYRTLWDSSSNLLDAVHFENVGGWEIQCRLYVLLLSILWNCTGWDEDMQDKSQNVTFTLS